MKEMLCEVAVCAVMICYLFTCPYTKVEESFNIQAIHDILYHGTNISKYDHHEFPGVVPRSFIGPLFFSGIALPSVNFLSTLNVPKNFMQFMVRFVIGCFGLIGLKLFSSALQIRFGSTVKKHFLLITAAQFHYLFYCTRPLPNTFAQILALPAIAFWLKKDMARFIWFSAFAIIVFRFELMILLGTCLLISLAQCHLSFRTLLMHAAPAGILALASTILIDSFIWERWLWPEGEVAWFNVVLNKSGEWGTSPFLWYFKSVLPRTLLTSAIFIPWGLRSDVYRCMSLAIPALTFILAFSLLPHKELRFIYYTFPLLNAISARAYADLYLRFTKSLKWKLLYIFALLCLVVNLFASSMFLFASMHNYPGGEIMDALHDKVPCFKPVHVHIANYAAQTGVTRFSELCPNWRYNKTENLDLNSLLMDLSTTHVILEPTSIDESLWSESHHLIAFNEIFSDFAIQRSSDFFNLPIPVLKAKPALALWERKTL